MNAPPPPHLGPRFQRALLLAYELHWDHRRPVNGAPYVGHVLAVAGTVIQSGGTEDEALVALLHDAPDRHGGRVMLERIEREFGTTVAASVRACSDPLEGMVEGNWRKRTEAFVLHARKERDAAALLVTAADKLDNLRAIAAAQRAEGDAVFERLEGGKEDRLWYYRALVESLRGARAEGRFPDKAAPVLEELERTLTQVESFAAGRRVL